MNEPEGPARWRNGQLIVRDLGEAVLLARDEQPGVYDIRLKKTGELLGRSHDLGIDVKCKGCKCIHCITWEEGEDIRQRLTEYHTDHYNLYCLDGERIILGLPGKRYPAKRVTLLMRLALDASGDLVLVP